MEAVARATNKAEFGDFQTPIGLATAVAARVRTSGFTPASIIEPTCGVGNMLVAAADEFPAFQRAIGVEIQPAYLAQLRSRLESRGDIHRIETTAASFFVYDWRATLEALPDPLLVIGNPPWVTNSDLSSMGSQNFPAKTNFQGHSGLDALTGKSNFDISEAILLKILDWLKNRDAMLAILCKTAVARKVLAHAWKHQIRIGIPSIWRIDSANSFGAAVDACVFECRFGGRAELAACPVYPSMLARTAETTIAYRAGRMLSDVDQFNRWSHLEGKEIYRWRSGIKHDCAEVVELRLSGDTLRKKSGEIADIEKEFVFPMLKASDLANDRGKASVRWMLVTQRGVGEETRHIALTAPKTWSYLTRHSQQFGKRASVIYRDRPAFSMFGVGEYSFAPWKVGIAGLYKKLQFTVIAPRMGKPVVLDDTCYFIGCQSEQEAIFIASLLNSTPAREFYSAFVFWDSKRPITIDLLRRLDLRNTAAELGISAEFERLVSTESKGKSAPISGLLWPE